jgi:predicted RND superfamily exporter protein
MGVYGFEPNPLLLVAPFLISAHSMSHNIQKLERYFLELELTRDRHIAARNTCKSLIWPDALALVADVAVQSMIGVSSVPSNDKMAIYASFRALTMVVTVLVTLPMPLTLLPQPRDTAIKHGLSRRILPWLAEATSIPSRSRRVLWTCLTITFTASYLGTRVVVDMPEPGSPLLHADHDYTVCRARQTNDSRDQKSSHHRQHQ